MERLPAGRKVLADSFVFVPHKPFQLGKGFPFLGPEGQQGRDSSSSLMLAPGSIALWPQGS